MTPPVAGALLRAAFVANSLRGDHTAWYEVSVDDSSENESISTVEDFNTIMINDSDNMSLKYSYIHLN